MLNTLEVNFDVEYCNMMVDGHKNAIKEFDQASTESTDLDIKEWAINTLPYLKSHLEQALICQKKYDIKK